MGPEGCARCGRPSHWAKECTALKDVDGNTPRKKPPKRKGSGKGIDDLGDEAADAAKEGEEEEGENMMLDEECSDDDDFMFVLEDIIDSSLSSVGFLNQTYDPWLNNDP